MFKYSDCFVFFLSHSLIQEWETKLEGCHSLATSSEWQPTNFVCHSLPCCFLLFVANPDVAWPQLKVQQLTLMLTVVNDNLSTCHFRAPVLTFRKCCPCPPKLGAPNVGGHESLPLQDCPNSQLSWRQRNQDHPLPRYHTCEECSPTYMPDAWEVAALL